MTTATSPARTPSPPSMLDGAFLTEADRRAFARCGAHADASASPVAIRLHATGGRPVHLRPGTMDAGTLAAILDRMPHRPPITLDHAASILHIGCDTGIIGAMLAASHPGATVACVSGAAPEATLTARTLAPFGDQARVLAARVAGETLLPPPGSDTGTPTLTLSRLLDDLNFSRVGYAIIDLREQPEALAGADARTLDRLDALRVWCSSEVQAHWAGALLQQAGLGVQTDRWSPHALVAVHRRVAARSPRYPRNETEIDPGPGQW